MPFDVLLSEQAERDIEDIYRYIAAQDGASRADRILNALEEACRGLSNLPERGNVPKEMYPLGIEEFREVHYKPYRVIYRIIGQTVVIYCVVDGRRDMQSLLQRRLVR
ncbi:MAG: type II toxin-antitoxin system RelE/ParE family toxin [Proteobacteria bacterium]|nr:type II toxin-antitoxin system RelE/ParE family toxin [Pseudomonadota bacterium]